MNNSYVVPVLALIGGFTLAVFGFKAAQNYMNPTGVKGFGGRRMGVAIRPQSIWEKNKMATGILHTLG